jgi:hypothetical protein
MVTAMGIKIMDKPINPIPPSPELSPWKRNIGTNPMMLRMTPPDNKIIPIRFLVFTGSSLAKSSNHHHRKPPNPHAIGIFHSIITLNIFPSSIEKKSSFSEIGKGTDVMSISESVGFQWALSEASVVDVIIP